jgi:hypothetical protein
MDSLQQQPHPLPSLHHPHQARHPLNHSAPDCVEGYSECIRRVRFSRTRRVSRSVPVAPRAIIDVSNTKSGGSAKLPACTIALDGCILERPHARTSH